MYDATFFRYCVAERSEQIFTGEGLVRDLSETSVQILRAPFFLVTLTCKFQLPFLAQIPASSSGETVSFTKCSYQTFLKLHLSALQFRKKPPGRKQCCYLLERLEKGKPLNSGLHSKYCVCGQAVIMVLMLENVCHGNLFLSGKQVKYKQSGVQLAVLCQCQFLSFEKY